MKISILGLGIIGGAWAKNLMADGHDVRCWNRTPKDFPNFHSSIHDAVDGAEVVFTIVADPPAVGSVLDQIEPKLRPGQLVIQSSTSGRERVNHTRILSRLIQPRVHADEQRLLWTRFNGITRLVTFGPH